jgi:hypothetical protein
MHLNGMLPRKINITGINPRPMSRGVNQERPHHGLQMAHGIAAGNISIGRLRGNGTVMLTHTKTSLLKVLHKHRLAIGYDMNNV